MRRYHAIEGMTGGDPEREMVFSENGKHCRSRGIWAVCRLFSLALALMALPGLARAELKVSVQGVGHSHTSPYVWTRVTVENPDARAVGFKLSGSLHYGSSGRTHLVEKELGPGAQRTYDLALLGAVGWGGHFGVSALCVDSTGRSAQDSQSDSEAKMFLNIAPMPQWASEQQMQDFSDAIEHPEGQNPGGMGPPMPGYPSSSGTPKKPNFVSQVEPNQLPDNWLCYTPFMVVLVSSDAYKTLSVEARAALIQWVNVGGHLIVYGASETRTELRLLGKIEYRTSPVLTALGQIPKEWKMLSGNPPASMLVWNRYSGMGANDNFPFMIESDVLGRSGGLILATLFCVVAGPVNYFYWRRKKRIRMLILSLPAFSIAFCLLITGYFLATKGFSRKGGTFSISILDEGTDSAVTFSRHLLFSGLYPLGGFSFDREAAFFPMELGVAGDQQYDMTLQNQQRQLTDGLFIPQVPFHYYTVMPWSTRERLIFKPTENAVENGFENPIQGVLVFSGGGVYTTGAIPKGGKAALERLEGEAAKNVLDRFLAADEKEFLERQEQLYRPLRNSLEEHYVVFFEGQLPTEQAGLKIKDGKHRHALVGAFGPQV